jgi:hypothetical protein
MHFAEYAFAYLMAAVATLATLWVFMRKWRTPKL